MFTSTSMCIAPNVMPLVVASELGLGAEVDITANPISIRPQTEPHGRHPGPWPPAIMSRSRRDPTSGEGLSGLSESGEVRFK